MLASSFENRLDLLELKADDDTVPPIGKFSRLDDPHIAPVRITFFLLLIEVPEEGKVIWIIRSFCDMEG